MTPLERELAGIAAGAFPEAPDLGGRVRARLAELPPPRARHAQRRLLVLALAVLAVTLGAALAVPQARSTILGWLGIGGVRVELVDRLPPVALDRTSSIGVPVSLDEARARVGFRVLVPTRELGTPDAVYVGRFTVDEVTLLYGRPRAVRALLTEVGGRLSIPFARKFVQGGARVEELSEGGRAALWIEASPHEFVFLAPSGGAVSAPLRLDANTLLWQRGALLLRLEGELTLEQALRVARSLR